MKTEEANERNALQKIAEKLIAAQQEIDELALQLALGKADAKDKFEEIKYDFRIKVSEFKSLLANLTQSNLSLELKARMDELEVQLSLGKAESKDLFEKQLKKILSALVSLEATKVNWQDVAKTDFFMHEVEQFKLKMEILRLRFRLKQFDIRADYQEKMRAVRREIKKLGSKMRASINTRQERYNDFMYEVSLAYQHIRNAVERLT